MQFQVPQFIEVEDKLFGSLTLKQFIYLTGAAGASVVLWIVLPDFLAFICAIPVIGFAAALAFYKVDDRPFISVLEAAFNFFLRSRLYIWKKEEKPVAVKPSAGEQQENLLRVPKLSDSKLKDLSWSLDIKESIYSSGAQQK
jgi:hypothetical protein